MTQHLHTRARLTFTLAALSASLFSFAHISAQVDPAKRSILFIRGADGSGGLGSGSQMRRTLHLSDISDTRGARNTGFGELAALLRSQGFTVSQWIESNGSLDAARLRDYRIVVFGSNNRVYSAQEVRAFETWWRSGGSALFVSDANWGSNWNAAPASDNQFLSLVGAFLYQDSASGVPVRSRTSNGHYLAPSHPVVSGPDGAGGTNDVDDFEGEGVSYFNVRGRSGVRVDKVVSAVGRRVRLLNASGARGGTRSAGPDDCALFAATLGRGRIVGHFDRNTWFNAGGVGSDIRKRDNARLALRIFEWLASESASVTSILSAGCGQPRTPRFEFGAPILGRSTAGRLRFAPVGAAAILLLAGKRQSGVVFPGCAVVPDLATAISLPLPSVDARGESRFALQLPPRLDLSSQEIFGQAVLVHTQGSIFGALDLSTAIRATLGWPY